MGFFHGALNDGVNVGFLNLCKAFRNRHAFIHAFNRTDEFYGFIRFADAFNADDVGKLRKAFINGAAVFFQNDR